ncbi:MAG: glycosyltransferase [Selenomonadaceae bacterium]|nr:glycosyltransferase [Selenomonadaceae bacterium]
MKVSVIIPVYNAEKFLGVCLESILIQTLQDFEVIVVDDCSTDNSVNVAESFLEKFGGRLKIISLPENTGSGAVPRNVGLEHAQGKYIFFVDNDDLLIDDALETLYNFAEEYQADVVYMEKFFTCDEEIIPKNLTVSVWREVDLIDEPTLEPNDLAKRVEKFLAPKFYWAPWAKFLRRDFLLDNKIFLPQMTIADDVIQTLEIICLAKKILRVPTPLYVWRTNQASWYRRKRSPEQMIKFRTSPLITGLEYLDEFMRGLAFFKKNPVLRLQVLNFFALMQLDNMTAALNELDSTEVYEIFLREFSTAGSSQPALISYLLVMNSLYRKELTK